VFDGPRACGAAALAAHADGARADAAWTSEIDAAAYAAAVQATREGIARGDHYQVNHTLRLATRDPVDPLALWARLRAAQLGAGEASAPGGYGAYVDGGAWQLASASPELFFARAGRALLARPMKGTAPRGRWSDEDDSRAAALHASAKERAENVMIVDLLRNDLARVAERGSVHVPALFDVERYPTVWQLTSSIAATARPGTTLADLFAALFPCGSVTGAPKIAAMRRIAAVERSPRGPYCGAVGVLAPGGDAVFSVAIRTAWAARGVTRYGVGGGVTWDSEPDAEWREAELKARVLHATRRPPFALLETLRLDGGAYPLEAAHLARLAASARYFAYADPTPAARAALAALAARADLVAGAWRVRLTAAADGVVQAVPTPAPPPPTAPWRVAVSRTPVDADDPFLHHKTTYRAVYESRRAEWPDADDVLLVNARGELTEGTIANLVVEREGRRWTPPRACGLLGGVARAGALAAGEVAEAVLHPTALAGAERAWLVNALRGWVPLRLGERSGGEAAPA
jgi:para-aminobenzoate synthetase/4-amino-4-deoxychorismate lyase